MERAEGYGWTLHTRRPRCSVAYAPHMHTLPQKEKLRARAFLMRAVERRGGLLACRRDFMSWGCTQHSKDDVREILHEIGE